MNELEDSDGRKRDKRTQEEVRIFAVRAVNDKIMTQAETARFYGVSEGAVSDWLTKYRHGGEARLKGDKRGTGKRSTILSAHQVNAVKKYIETKTPDELNLPFLLWSLEAVRELISVKYKKEIASRTLSTLMNDWGFSAQKPAKKAMEQNPEIVANWLEEEYPAIEKKAKQEKAEINWLDESGIQSTDNRGRSYAKRGKTPSVKISAKRNRANFVSTVNKLGVMRFMTYLGKMNSKKLIEFLRRLIKGSKKKIFLVVDNFSVHKSREVREWLEVHQERIEVFYLPTYSPDLNPDELLNRHLKSVIFKEERPTSRESLRKLTERKLRVIQSDKNLVKSYFNSKSTSYAGAA